jgi:4-diphosphocytidyl-2-C-methyl-D-erythritol kinase
VKPDSAVQEERAFLTAPAKLTRHLRVTGLREDGYHLLEAEMVTLGLADELEVSAGTGLELLDEIGWVGERLSPAQARPGAEFPLAENGNLVEDALRAVGRDVHVRLRKRIPVGAGLGGGSADAAAVLRWAGCTDLGVAASLGADVPFCVLGGRALVAGVGGVVKPLPYERLDVLLVVPAVSVSTPAVYAAWDALGGPRGDFGNDLEPAALEVEPRLGWWRDLVASVTGRRPRLAGSGGTWWTNGAAPELTEQAARLSAAVAKAGEKGLVQVTRTVPAP